MAYQARDEEQLLILTPKEYALLEPVVSNGKRILSQVFCRGNNAKLVWEEWRKWLNDKQGVIPRTAD